VGLNHLSWERSITVNGKDLLPDLLSQRLGELAEEVESAPAVLAQLGMVPSYYLHYYYDHDQVLEEQLHEPTRAEAVKEVERELLGLYADPSVDTKPEALERRGGAFYSESAVELMASMQGGQHPPRVVNLRNDGLLNFLPDDHVVEVPARFVDGAFVAEPVAPLPDDITGLIGAVAAYERLALDAAVHGGRDRVVRALRAHPLVLQHERADKLADLLLAANRDFLPWL
jgi:6-phospho-beta-glucosidase